MAEAATELDQFRREISEFLDKEVTESIREAGRKMTSLMPPFEESMAFHRLLHKRGWAATSWPKEYGGTGWDIHQQRIFSEECRKRKLPAIQAQGIGMVGPAIIHFGTDEQKQRYLPGILSGEDFWGQGYSEPNSGSDLVSLQCKAVRDGDEYVINGSKTWMTYGHYAQRIFMLVRTSSEGKPQRGISFLLLDRVDYPGMEIREIIGLDGLPEQCEVFFDNVRVPLDSCLSEENNGWSVAKYLLEHERGGGGTSSVASYFYQELAAIKAKATELGDGFGNKLVDDPAFQQRFADLYLDVCSLDATEAQCFNIDKGSPDSGPMTSVVKILWSETLQQINEFSLDVTGVLALPLQQLALEVGSDVEPLDNLEALTVMPKYLNNRACTLYGGSSEILRNIIAGSLLAR